MSPGWYTYCKPWAASLALILAATLTAAFSTFLAGASQKLYADAKLTFTEVYTVGTLEEPEEELFGRYQTVALAGDGTLYVGDKDVDEVRVFDVNGQFVGTIGRKGQGPGEFERLSTIALSAEGDSLYVFDRGPRRVSVFSTDQFELARDFVVEGLSPSVKMYPLASGRFMFVGYGTEGDELVHVRDAQGHPVRSIGWLLRIDEPKYDTRFMRNQLNLGVATEAGNGEIIAGLIAPYRIARFAPSGEVRWQIEEDILPDPWDGYIEYTPDRYSVRLYPQIVNLHMAGSRHFIVTHYNFEEEKGYYDIRDARDGSLLARHTIPDTKRARREMGRS